MPFKMLQQGSTLIEVLVTFLIVSIGLLGLFGMQARLQSTDMDAYQRSQALILLNDMVNRIESNRNVIDDYVTGVVYGTGMNCPAATVTQKDRDLMEWCQALQGASEVSGGSNVGAMIGGRGCVENLAGNQYMVTIAWQGLTPLTAPSVGVTCGANNYNTDGTACVNDLCRRTVTAVIGVAAL
jgi:type IV pilus assembly protein PilV